MKAVLLTIALFGVAFGHSWEAESIRVIKSRMAKAESVADARRLDSIRRTIEFDNIRLGDSVEISRYAGVIVAIAQKSYRRVSLNEQFNVRGWAVEDSWKIAGPCVVIQSYAKAEPFTDWGGGWHKDNTSLIVWREDVQFYEFTKKKARGK